MKLKGKEPHCYFAEPGEVAVSPAALELARQFEMAVRQARPGGDWLVTFDWALGRRVRHRPDGPWEDFGPGVDLGAGPRSDTPPELIQRVDGLDFAIKVPREIYEQFPERLIDVDETAFSKLALR